MRRTRILIADAVEMFRSGVSSVLARESDFAVVTAANLEGVVRASPCPDIALIDANLPPRGGLAAVARLAETCSAYTILWSSHPSQQDVLRAIRAGASGYLHKETSPRGLVRSLRGIARGEAALARDLAALVIEGMHDDDEREQARERFSGLSTREREVLGLVVQGARNKEIASELYISEFTVKRHMQNILQKLDVPSRRAAADFYQSAYGGAAVLNGNGAAATTNGRELGGLALGPAGARLGRLELAVLGRRGGHQLAEKPP
jgi:two-component system, NarL family, nitrate/nitrite response regulator NarP